jgi:hypothetical protein
MTSYRNKYLEMLKTDFGKKPLPNEPSKSSKLNFEDFESSEERPVSEIPPPPFTSAGIPCGVCPSCRQGEFLRYPKFHKDHDHRGWVCWFCSPPPEGSGPCDFCGVPEHSK